jgi:hypothetical protein
MTTREIFVKECRDGLIHENTTPHTGFFAILQTTLVQDVLSKVFHCLPLPRLPTGHGTLVRYQFLEGVICRRHDDGSRFRS